MFWLIQSNASKVSITAMLAAKAQFSTTTNSGKYTTNCVIVFIITWQHFCRARHGRKSGIWRWNFDLSLSQSLELWQIASKFQRQIRRARYKISQIIATTIDYQQLQDWRPKRLCCYFRLSVIVAITWRHFIRAHHGRKPRTCRWNFDAICCSSTGITITGFGTHIAIFGCRSMLQSLIDTASSSWSKTLGWPSEL